MNMRTNRVGGVRLVVKDQRLTRDHDVSIFFDYYFVLDLKI
jgi:hypothetical protein